MRLHTLPGRKGGRQRVTCDVRTRKCHRTHETYICTYEINSVFGYSHFEDTEKAMYIYDHLEREA